MAPRWPYRPNRVTSAIGRIVLQNFSLRLANRDSVGMRRRIAGAVYDGTVRGRTGSVLLRV